MRLSIEQLNNIIEESDFDVVRTGHRNMCRLSIDGYAITKTLDKYHFEGFKPKMFSCKAAYFDTLYTAWLVQSVKGLKKHETKV